MATPKLTTTNSALEFCDACRQRHLTREPDGRVWDMGTGAFTIPRATLPRGIKGEQLLLCWCCAWGLRLLDCPPALEGIDVSHLDPIALGPVAVFDRRLLRQAFSDWMDERGAEWTPEGSLDRAFGEFYERARRRRLSVVGDERTKAERRRYLRARRKSIQRARAEMQRYLDLHRQKARLVK
jgi:hypothetical protein